MNKVIHKKNIKYVKICLISPLFELITNFVYIVSFLLLSFKFYKMGGHFSNYDINQMTREYLDEKRFRAIGSDLDFVYYLELTLNKLYTFDSEVHMPIMYPLGSIKMIKYVGDKARCSALINSTSCHDYFCITSRLNNLYSTSNCGKPYEPNKTTMLMTNSTGDRNNSDANKANDPFQGLIGKFAGFYSSYNLFSDGEQIDLTIDEYLKNEAYYEKFIKDHDLKFIVLIINMLDPSSDVYINIIAGIEMITYFNPIRPIFTVSVYNTCDPNDSFFLTMFIFFSIAIILNLIKLLYEVNVKLIFSVHIFCLANECLNILLFIFICFYLTSANFKDFNPLDKTHHSHLPLMAIRKYLTVIVSMTMICIPFRLISLISWSKYISKPFVKYIGAIFRMIPGVLISIMVIGSIFYMFSLMNYALYHEHFYQFSSIYNTFLALFNPQIVLELIHPNSKLYDAITISPYYIFINIFQLLIILLLLVILTGTMSYLFKRASALEEEKMENEIMTKLAQIEEKLTEGNDSIDNDLKKLKKQILWLNLSHKNEVYNQYSSKNDLLLFKKSNQVISFLKYLFAIKPELQFKNLYNKFGILIEIKNEKASLKDTELDQIEILVDWLMFVGCKIPVVLYSQLNLEKTIRMKFHSIYRHISYVTDQNDIYNFIKVMSKENVCCHAEKFSYAFARGTRIANTLGQNAIGNMAQQVYGTNNNSNINSNNNNGVNNSPSHLNTNQV